MLKSKYKFKLSEHQTLLLNSAVDLLYARYGNSKDLELQLPIVVLMDFKMRLAAQMVFPKLQTPVYLKPAEAVAFMMLYRSGLICTNLTTSMIAHHIDRTI